LIPSFDVSNLSLSAGADQFAPNIFDNLSELYLFSHVISNFPVFPTCGSRWSIFEICFGRFFCTPLSFFPIFFFRNVDLRLAKTRTATVFPGIVVGRVFPTCDCRRSKKMEKIKILPDLVVTTWRAAAQG